MKKCFFLTAAITITTCAFGQITTPDTAKKEFKNIIGIDATGLVLQFLNFNNTKLDYPYMISYRRILKSNAIRVGVGGTFYSNKAKDNDSLNRNSTINNFNIGLGFEHYCYLSKRWNFYFGADVIGKYSLNNSIYEWTSKQWQHINSTTYECGISPLLGLVFKVNSRLFIATETSYDILYTATDYKRIYHVNTPSNDAKSKITGVETSFNAPVTVNLRMQF